MAWIFWIAVFGVFFAYFGYPLSLYALRLLWRPKVVRTSIAPDVSLIITAYNEEKRIAAKLENTLRLEYAEGKLEIIVASDGSTDRTNAIVKQFISRGVRLLELAPRRGKEHAQKDAVAAARGEILIFTDVATMLDPKGVARIIENFGDPSVGCASSVDRVIGQSGQVANESLYVRYEMWLRDLESRANSVVGLSGSFFAARRNVCEDFSGEMQSDFRTLLNSIRLGMRGVSDPQAIGYYLDVSDPKREMDRKIRTVVRGLTVFFRHIELLNFLRYGLFSYQLFCHKLVRWLVPAFMAAALASNFLLITGSVFYTVLMALQAAFYAMAVIPSALGRTPSSLLLKIPSYFLTVNLAILRAWWRYLIGQRIVMWEPSRR
jgi:glycosyltransferase involved in cell wall biosynthesis